MKKMEKNKLEDIPCSWTERSNKINMSVLLIAMYKFKEIAIKIPMVFFTELEKNPKICT